MLNNVTIKDNKLYNVHAHLIYILWELLNSCSSWNVIWKWQFPLGWKMEGVPLCLKNDFPPTTFFLGNMTTKPEITLSNC